MLAGEVGQGVAVGAVGLPEAAVARVVRGL
jgi:hypothetical protein